MRLKINKLIIKCQYCKKYSAARSEKTMKYFARFFIIPALLFVGFIGCRRTVIPVGDPVSYVDPMIGTGVHGHTFPGATVPFGMVQISPDTRGENWDGSSGYHYSDPTIMGFSQTHLSGTGAPEFCDVLFMPTVGKVRVKVGDENDPSTGYRSTFRHANEQASAGYYSVLLDDYGVRAELTATKRTGFHRYTFPASKESNIIIDLQSRGHVVESNIEFLSDREIQGLRRSSAWAKDQYVYFYAKFSKPFSAFGIALDDSLIDGLKSASGKNVKAYVRYATDKDEQILVKIGISAVSCDGARKNLEAENDGWDFDGIAAQAKFDWNDYLSKITVEGGTKKQRRIFYTALYHTAVSPNLFMDVDGRFRGVDHQVHRAEGFTNYTVFSLWDTFRALMPLYTIIEPDHSADFIKTFLSMYRIGGRLPKWEIAGNYSGAMIGFHSLPVILDAYAKGIRGFDADLALQAMKASMQSGGPALTFFRNLGFIPADKEVGSVSKAMEYAYDAWCVYKMAKALGDENDAEVYGQYALFYRNQFDPSTGFMRPKKYDRTWVSPFDPAEGSEHYVEGNAYQYTLFAPQDVDGLIDLFGGDAKFIAWLDALFTTTSKYDAKVVDAAGLIGQYAHGNEPSHNLA
ncbi:MAG: glycoside hydrolase family 92 protein [Actinobacteria bacterium]|nr:glycoside hydrolase family 92 protein [Actinomycetota bacterium]